MFGLGVTEWVIIAFFFFDTVVAVGVILFFNAKKKKTGNSGFSNDSFHANSNANSMESPFSSITSSTTSDSDILVLLQRGQKIEAIKIYRERYNVGLKEAKDAVEAMERQNR